MILRLLSHSMDVLTTAHNDTCGCCVATCGVAAFVLMVGWCVFICWMLVVCLFGCLCVCVCCCLTGGLVGLFGCVIACVVVVSCFWVVVVVVVCFSRDFNVH